MNSEISLKLLLKVFKSSWWKILIIVLVVVMAVGAYTSFFVEKKYSSNVSFYVVNINNGTEYTTTALITAAQQLASDYIEIIKSDRVLVPVSEGLKEAHDNGTYSGELYSVAAIRKMISTSQKTETSIFTVSVTNVDKKAAYLITTLIADLSPDIISDITKRTTVVTDENTGEKKLEKAVCLEVLTDPVEAKTHDSTGLVRNSALGGLIAFFLAYVVFTLKLMWNTVIRTEDDVKSIVNEPILGVIPSWENRTVK